MEGNVTSITDGSDAILPESYIASGDALRREKVLALRREFLNTNGEDYFVLHPEQAESYLNLWNTVAAQSFASTGNYEINTASGDPVNQITDGLETAKSVELTLKHSEISAQDACCNNPLT